MPISLAFEARGMKTESTCIWHGANRGELSYAERTPIMSCRFVGTNQQTVPESNASSLGNPYFFSVMHDLECLLFVSLQYERTHYYSLHVMFDFGLDRLNEDTAVTCDDDNYLARLITLTIPTLDLDKASHCRS